MWKLITSSLNETIKRIRKLDQKSVRYEMGLYLIEGKNMLRELMEHENDALRDILVSQSYFEGAFSKDFPELSKDHEGYVLEDRLFSSVSDTKTPQGVIAVCEMKKAEMLHVERGSLYIYCDEISDPGNLGTIIRTADAAGLDGILLSKGCVDFYNPKVIRSTMGGIFHLSATVMNDPVQELLSMKKMGFQVLAGCLTDAQTLYTCDLTQKTVLCVGNEAHGLREEIIEISDKKVKIPILGKAESLNASVAASVMMYEALRQRL